MPRLCMLMFVERLADDVGQLTPTVPSQRSAPSPVRWPLSMMLNYDEAVAHRAIYNSSDHARENSRF